MSEPIDAQGVTWLRLRKFIDRKIAEAHGALELKGMPEQQTCELRGEIAAYRDIIREVEGDKMPIEGAAVDYNRQ